MQCALPAQAMVYVAPGLHAAFVQSVDAVNRNLLAQSQGWNDYCVTLEQELERLQQTNAQLVLRSQFSEAASVQAMEKVQELEAAAEEAVMVRRLQSLQAMQTDADMEALFSF